MWRENGSFSFVRDEKNVDKIQGRRKICDTDITKMDAFNTVHSILPNSRRFSMDMRQRIKVSEMKRGTKTSMTKHQKRVSSF